MNRIVVVGSSGSGKTTIARRLSDVLDLPLLELDSVAHREGFADEPRPWFGPEVSDFVNQERWVVDGNYTSWGTSDLVWPRADTIVWPDLPRHIVMWRVTRRTLRRVVTREKLWGGVKEPFSNLYSRDPYKNLMVWTWTRYRHVTEKFETAASEGSWDHATVHRLRSQPEIDQFLSELNLKA